jgi:hypothetical protein
MTAGLSKSSKRREWISNVLDHRHKNVDDCVKVRSVANTAQDVPELVSFCRQPRRSYQAITEVSPLGSELSTILPGTVAPTGGGANLR